MCEMDATDTGLRTATGLSVNSADDWKLAMRCTFRRHVAGARACACPINVDTSLGSGVLTMDRALVSDERRDDRYRLGAVPWTTNGLRPSDARLLLL